MARATGYGAASSKLGVRSSFSANSDVLAEVYDAGIQRGVAFVDFAN